MGVFDNKAAGVGSDADDGGAHPSKATKNAATDVLREKKWMVVKGVKESAGREGLRIVDKVAGWRRRSS
jgi:hypothetical protein